MQLILLCVCVYSFKLFVSDWTSSVLLPYHIFIQSCIATIVYCIVRYELDNLAWSYISYKCASNHFRTLVSMLCSESCPFLFVCFPLGWKFCPNTVAMWKVVLVPTPCSNVLSSDLNFKASFWLLLFCH